MAAETWLLAATALTPATSRPDTLCTSCRQKKVRFGLWGDDGLGWRGGGGPQGVLTPVGREQYPQLAVRAWCYHMAQPLWRLFLPPCSSEQPWRPAPGQENHTNNPHQCTHRHARLFPAMRLYSPPCTEPFPGLMPSQQPHIQIRTSGVMHSHQGPHAQTVIHYVRMSAVLLKPTIPNFTLSNYVVPWAVHIKRLLLLRPFPHPMLRHTPLQLAVALWGTHSVFPTHISGSVVSHNKINGELRERGTLNSTSTAFTHHLLPSN